MMWTNIRFIAGSIGMAACVGEVVVVWLRNVIFQWARLDGSPFERRQGYVCPTFVVWKKRLVFAFVEVLNQKLDNGWLVIRKTDDSTLCFLSAKFQAAGEELSTLAHNDLVDLVRVVTTTDGKIRVCARFEDASE
jgi:hypothetical protein